MGMTEIIDTANELRRKKDMSRHKKPPAAQSTAAGGGTGPPQMQRQPRGATTGTSGTGGETEAPWA